MARHMPKVAASWVAGQYDNDKSVSRAANESFRQVFSSEEKINNVWRLYQTSLLEYAMDVIVKETANTLSDERTTSPDDSASKYSRVVGASILMVTNLMGSIPEANMQKGQILLTELLNEEKLWKFASDNDAFVRRALYHLLGTVLPRYKDALNPSTISACVLMSGLNTPQSGSALDFTKLLASLSVELPDIWTKFYPGSGKKSATKRLCQFLKKGSQGGPPEFWSQVAILLLKLPPSILVLSLDKSDEKIDGEKDVITPVLDALREGLNSREEPRANRAAAWNAYLTTSDLALSSFPDVATQRRILTFSVLPIVAQHIRPSPDSSRWAVTGTKGEEVCVRACDQVISRNAAFFTEEWNALSNTIIQDFQTSLPEQAKDYARSQDSLFAEAERWYCLQATLLKGNTKDTASTVFEHTVPLEVISALSVLKARVGKPYGVAAALEISIQKLPEIVLSNEGCKNEFFRFINESLPDLLLSPSAKYLIRILNHLDGSCDINRSYDKCMQILVKAPESGSKSIALQSFISSPRLAVTDSLSAMVMTSLDQVMSNDDLMRWNLVMAAMRNPMAPKSLTDEVLASMTDDLSIDSKTGTGLHGLEMTIKHNSGIVTQFAQSTKGSNLLSKLLLLADSPDDDVAQRAKYTSATIEQALAAQGGVASAKNSLIEIVKSGLDTASPVSLSYVDSCLPSLI